MFLWYEFKEPSSLSAFRGLGLTIAAVLLLAFAERPSSFSISSDPRHRSPAWQPPCGLTESIEMICLIILSVDVAVKVSGENPLNQSKRSHRSGSGCVFFPQSYLIGWEEFGKSKWLIGYTVVILISVMDWVLSVSMVCDEVRISPGLIFLLYRKVKGQGT